MKRILTGITPSGYPHLGNYIGAIKPSLDLLDENCESFLFIADLHAVIKVSDPERLNELSNSIAMAWLASGLDPERTNFYRQSDVPEITELAWLLSCITEKGLLNRAHAYKAAIDTNNESGKKDIDEGISVGLFSYPLLMASDILTLNATHVPVGKDQQQHLEMTRDVASRFNNIYGQTFVLPEGKVNEDTMLVQGTNGEKMSKSKGNTIDIFLPEKALKKQVMSIQTDSTPIEDPKDYKNCNVFKIYKLIADQKSVDKVKSNYLKGGYGYGHAKKELLNFILTNFSEERQKFEYYMSNKNELEKVLKLGAEKANLVAQEVLNRVREKLGYNKN